jgi:hypothetical protein
MAQVRPDFAKMVTAAIARDHSLVPLQPEHPNTDVDNLSGLGANFLAHLIATRDKAPQTRTIRRASPDEAIESYTHATAVEDDVVTLRKS